MIPKKLSIYNNIYYVNNRKDFDNSFGIFLDEDIDKVIRFAYDMIDEDAHRHIRSGGTLNRGLSDIFADAFNGKLGEFGVYRYFESLENFTCTPPDVNIYPRHSWDNGDIYITSLDDGFNRHVAIKTTKDFGNLLLLETKDWSETGLYLPSESTERLFRPDRFLFVRIKPFLKGYEIKKYIQTNNFDGLVYYIMDKQNIGGWHYDIVGYITLEDFIYLIKNNYVLKKGSFLNGKYTIMDADNYYIQSKDLRELKE